MHPTRQAGPGIFAIALLFLSLLARLLSAEQPGRSSLVFPGPDGKLQYKPYTDKGDTLPDFSHCGFGGGGVAIPSVPVRLTVFPEPGSGDDTARLQTAIDQLSAMPVDAAGTRGALLLKRGEYRVKGSLKIAASGMVLRGEGDGEQDTVLIAAGTSRRHLIEVGGASGPKPAGRAAIRIADDYVPVGARTFRVTDATGLKTGDTVFVRREGNAAWIHFIGMDRITPRPGHPEETRQWGPFALAFDRVITAVNRDRITIDAPIVCAIDRQWGGGDVQPYNDPNRIQNVGIEFLRGVSEFDRNKKGTEHGKIYFNDEDHAEQLVGFDSVKNAWAKHVTAVHFYSGVANFGTASKWITVQDSSAIDPVSEITGGRRYPFSMSGQLLLVQRCFARDARHAFVVGSHVCGPNVFLDCRTEDNHATSEPHHRWSVGGLYDNVDAPIAIQDRQYLGSGHGWAGANYVVWNCTGSLVCQQPPTAQNFAIGFVGKKDKGAFPRPDGFWESVGRHVEPRSLYLQQLQDRLGPAAVDAIAR